jgi:hypothetical protein
VVQTPPFSSAGQISKKIIAKRGMVIRLSHLEENQQVVLDFYEQLLGAAKESSHLIYRLSACNNMIYLLWRSHSKKKKKHGQPSRKYSPTKYHALMHLLVDSTKKACWTIIKDDFLQPCQQYSMSMCSNFAYSTWILLLFFPKEVDVVFVKDFGPIRFICSFAMLVTKLMANHLAPLLPENVTVAWSAFVKGRSIQDSSLLI